MLLEFTKMHGLGNDFLVLDLISQRAYLDALTIQRLADRHFGIGFDQLLIVEPPDFPNADFKYRIFNADGSEVEQCGNGVRCFARFVHERKLTAKTKIKVQTKAGIVEPELGKNGWVRVNMGYPKFLPDEIPFIAEEPENLYDIRLPDGEELTVDVVNMGNPHVVTIVPMSSRPMWRALARSWNRMSAFRPASTPALCRLLMRSMRACAYLSAASARLWPAAQAPARLRFQACAAACCPMQWK
jgi:diaminopimelate epimerase